MTSSPRSVWFVVPSLAGGGAERTFVNLLNHLDRTRYRPRLILFRKEGPFLAHLASDVDVSALKVSRGYTAVIKLAWMIRRSRPDLILSTLKDANAITLLAAKLAGLCTPVILRETNHQTAAGTGLKEWKERLIQWSYRQADAVVALSNGVREDILSRYDMDSSRVVTIYNPVDLEAIEKALKVLPNDGRETNGSGHTFHVVSVGSLTYQKGHDLLLQALAGIQDVPWQLTIVGEGPLRPDVTALADQLGILHRVDLVGFQQNPYPFVAKADLFVLSSRWEGFGHVIVEAMACGTPVLASRCASGPDEIIADGVNGRLCEPGTAEALAKAIRELWERPEDRARFAMSAKQSINRFDCNEIIQRYETLFSDVLRERKAAASQ